jgi:hypothetical protein
MKDPFSAPVVYVGSTLTADEVRRLLPGAIVRPPARRLDLYRARALGASTLVLIDGVFFQQLAVSPREVLDVLADGARVLGASSMGALRAAECWPCGMIGKGVIYRLFKRGALDSDDEVAVSFRADRPEEGSVALVNVRYAARQAARSGALSQAQAQALVRAAQGLFFADRHWPRILAEAGVTVTASVRASLQRCDLKRADALRCLRYASGLQPLPSAPRVLVPRELTRERSVDARQHAPRDAQTKLAAWLLLTGRYRKLLPESASRRLLEAPPSPRLSRALWRALEEKGLLEAELFRYLAFVEGTRRASGQRASLEGTAATRDRLALEHCGAADWRRFAGTLGPRSRRRLLTFSARMAAAREVSGASAEPYAAQQGTKGCG